MKNDGRVLLGNPDPNNNSSEASLIAKNRLE